MKKKKHIQWLAGLLLLSMLVLFVATPAQAFESMSGGNVVIEASETIEDDLYVGANTFTLRGTIKGDLIAAGSEIVIAESGVVEGDLLAVGQSVTVKGVVMDDARLGAAAITVDENAQIGDDLIGAGYSLEIAPGSSIGGDLVFAGAQLWLSGEVAGSALVGVGTAFRLEGKIGDDVKVDIGDAQDAPPIDPMQFIPGMPTIPSIPAGLTFGENAHIEGNLDYTSLQVSDIPNGAIGGKTTRHEPILPDKEEEAPPPTTGEILLQWLVKLVRRLVTLLIVGLILAWLFPRFIRKNIQAIQEKPWHSLLWGVVALFAYFVLLIALILLIGILTTLFSAATLNQLTLTTLWAGLSAISVYLLAFKIVTSYLVYIVLGALVGLLIFERFSAALAENRFWPMILGVVILGILATIPYLGVLINVLVLFWGLGALWLIGSKWYAGKKKAGLAPE